MKKQKWKELALRLAGENNMLKNQNKMMKDKAAMSHEIGAFIYEEIAKVIATKQ